MVESKSDRELRRLVELGVGDVSIGAEIGYDGGQKAELKHLIERRKEWFPTSGLCRAAG